MCVSLSLYGLKRKLCVPNWIIFNYFPYLHHVVVWNTEMSAACKKRWARSVCIEGWPWPPNWLYTAMHSFFSRVKFLKCCKFGLMKDNRFFSAAHLAVMGRGTWNRCNLHGLSEKSTISSTDTKPKWSKLNKLCYFFFTFALK